MKRLMTVLAICASLTACTSKKSVYINDVYENATSTRADVAMSKAISRARQKQTIKSASVISQRRITHCQNCEHYTAHVIASNDRRLLR